ATLSGCAAYPGGNCGVFSAVYGTAPNRVFVLEWRAVYFSSNTTLANFELRLHEDSPGINCESYFDVFYNNMQTTFLTTATIGLQRSTGTQFTQYSCSTTYPTNGTLLTFRQAPCATPTPSVTNTPPVLTFTFTPTCTPTPTFTNTPTNTNTLTPTPVPCGNYAI